MIICTAVILGNSSGNLVRTVKYTNSNNHCLKVTGNVNIRKIIYYNKEAYKLLKISSAEHGLGYYMKIICIATNEKTVFEGNKIKNYSK